MAVSGASSTVNANPSAISQIFSIVNQLQLLFTLALLDVNLPNKMQGLIEGYSFTMLDFGFMKDYITPEWPSLGINVTDWDLSIETDFNSPVKIPIIQETLKTKSGSFLVIELQALKLLLLMTIISLGIFLYIATVP